MTSASIRESFKALGDLLLPRRCLCCGRRLDTHEDHLCLYCKADMPYTYYWNRLTNPMADRFNECIQRHLCEDAAVAEDMQEPYAYAASLFFYRSGYREITKALKYHGNLKAGRHFAALLGQKLASSALFSDVDLIVPVPLHWSRRWQRGYNQAEVIAAQLAGKIPGARMLPGLLRRCRRTTTQTRLDVEEKRLNVSRAFITDTKVLAGCTGVKHILVVDDVFTTGATLSECHRALRASFGREVRISVATLACVGD